jgi:hypothetical protein
MSTSLVLIARPMQFFYQIRVLSISACSTGVKGRRVGYFRASEFMSRVLVQDFSHFLFS